MGTYGLDGLKDPFPALVDVVLMPWDTSAVSQPTGGGQQKVPLMLSKSHSTLILNADQVGLRCVHWFVREADEDRCVQGTWGYRRVKVCSAGVFAGEDLSRPVTGVPSSVVHYS